MSKKVDGKWVVDDSFVGARTMNVDHFRKKEEVQQKEYADPATLKLTQEDLKNQELVAEKNVHKNILKLNPNLQKFKT